MVAAASSRPKKYVKNHCVIVLSMQLFNECVKFSEGNMKTCFHDTMITLSCNHENLLLGYHVIRLTLSCYYDNVIMLS
jgi:hypothetical protein